MSTRVLRVSLAAVALVATAACGADDDPDGANDLDWYLENAPANQRVLLEDGELTYAEYEQAVISARDCVIEAGYEPGPIELTQGLLGYEIEVDYTGESDPEAADQRFLEITDSCWNDNTGLVSMFWAQTLVLDRDEKEAMRPEVIACLNDAGLDLPDNASDDQIAEALIQDAEDNAQVVGPSPVDECLDEFYQFFLMTP
ncbi:hypothetical protein [Salana multivorans]